MLDLLILGILVVGDCGFVVVCVFACWFEVVGGCIRQEFCQFWVFCANFLFLVLRFYILSFVVLLLFPGV